MSKDYQKEYRENMPDEQKQRYRDKQIKYRNNMTDEQKQKQREADRRYQKKYRDNMTDERKQKLRDYQINYQKKYYATKKSNNNDNKIIDDSDNDNKIIDDNDFYYISIIIKLKNIVPIKDINLTLKIHKKMCSQAYLEGCNFINDGDNKYKIMEHSSPLWILEHFGFFKLKTRVV